jgi:hypothetical protein
MAVMSTKSVLISSWDAPGPVSSSGCCPPCTSITAGISATGRRPGRVGPPCGFMTNFPRRTANSSKVTVPLSLTRSSCTTSRPTAVGLSCGPGRRVNWSRSGTPVGTSKVSSVGPGGPVLSEARPVPGFHQSGLAPGSWKTSSDTASFSVSRKCGSRSGPQLTLSRARLTTAAPSWGRRSPRRPPPGRWGAPPPTGRRPGRARRAGSRPPAGRSRSRRPVRRRGCW